jgi:hypothetical protein
VRIGFVDLVQDLAPDLKEHKADVFGIEQKIRFPMGT